MKKLISNLRGRINKFEFKTRIRVLTPIVIGFFFLYLLITSFQKTISYNNNSSDGKTSAGSSFSKSKIKSMHHDTLNEGEKGASEVKLLKDEIPDFNISSNFYKDDSKFRKIMELSNRPLLSDSERQNYNSLFTNRSLIQTALSELNQINADTIINESYLVQNLDRSKFLVATLYGAENRFVANQLIEYIKNNNLDDLSLSPDVRRVMAENKAEFMYNLIQSHTYTPAQIESYLNDNTTKRVFANMISYRGSLMAEANNQLNEVKFRNNQ